MLRRGLVPALLVFAAGCEPTAPGNGPGAGGFSLLIERRNAAGQRAFYAMSGDGDRFTPFTGVPADARALIPSPDGRTIAYLRDIDSFIELWAMDRDGANRRAILAGAYYVETAAWSPDGSKLAIGFSTETSTSDIATINADGTGFFNLTPDAGSAVIFDRDPAWSRDGSRIAFSSNRSGGTRLWTMNADGTSPTDVLASSITGPVRNPVWAPDTTNFIAGISGNGIFFVRADGTDYKLIPISPGPNDLVWLPDGRLAYVANPTGDYDIWTVDRASGETSQITSRRDHDVRAAVLADAAPFAWLGFATPMTYQVNRPFVADMAIADVLTDGRPDLLILSPVFNEIRVMRGSATGTLQSVGALFAEGDVARLFTGFVTNDAAPDVVGRADSAAYVWRGRVDGPGIATRIAAGGELRGVGLADLDASGRDDIIMLVENEGQPFRLRTHTIGSTDNFVFAVDMPTSRTDGRGLCTGDMTGDGRADVAILAGATSLSAWLARGRGELGVDDPTAAGSNLSSDVEAVARCADFNNDGKDDLLLFTEGASQGVAVHRFGTTAFGTASRIQTAASAIAVADVDRDGDLDVVMVSSTTAAIMVARNRGGGSFDSPTSYAIANPAVAVAAADLNGDAWPDVAAIDATGSLVVLLSRGRTGM